jgi:hypothetical protein
VIDVAFCPVRAIKQPLIKNPESTSGLEALTLSNCGLRSVFLKSESSTGAAIY